MYFEVATPDTTAVTKLSAIGVQEKNPFLPSSYFKNRKGSYVYFSTRTALPMHFEEIRNINILTYNPQTTSTEYIPVEDIVPTSHTTITVEAKNKQSFSTTTLTNLYSFTASTDDIYAIIVKRNSSSGHFYYRDLIPLTEEETVGLSRTLKHRITGPLFRGEGILLCQQYSVIKQNYESLYNRIHNTLLYYVRLFGAEIQHEKLLRPCYNIKLQSNNTNPIITTGGILLNGEIC